MTKENKIEELDKKIHIHSDGDIFVLQDDGKYHYAGFFQNEGDKKAYERGFTMLLQALKKTKI